MATPGLCQTETCAHNTESAGGIHVSEVLLRQTTIPGPSPSNLQLDGRFGRDKSLYSLRVLSTQTWGA